MKYKTAFSRIALGMVLVVLCSTTLAQPALPTGAIQSAPAQYIDIPAGHWAAEAINKLTHVGIITGYPDGTFGGTQALSRYEIAVIAARILDHVDAVVAANRQGVGSPVIMTTAEGTPIVVATPSQGGTSTTAQPTIVQTTPQFTTPTTTTISPEALQQMEQTAATLRDVHSLSVRIDALQNALSEAAAQSYVQALEGRVSSLEEELMTLKNLVSTKQSNFLNVDQSQRVGSNVVKGNSAVARELNEILPASVQPSTEHPLFFGIAPSLVSGDGFVISLYGGYDNLLPPFSFMSRVRFDGIEEEARITGNLVYRFGISDLPASIKFYGGLGFGANIRADASTVLVEFPVGAEYYVSSRMSVFIQATGGYSFSPIDEYETDVSIGLNIHF